MNLRPEGQVQIIRALTLDSEATLSIHVLTAIHLMETVSKPYRSNPVI